MNKFVVLLGVFFISACGGSGGVFSMGNDKPLDEFSVMQAPSLDIPPDFNLRPPVDEEAESSAEIKGEVSENEKEILEKMGESDSNTDSKPTEADEEFLNKI